MPPEEERNNYGGKVYRMVAGGSSWQVKHEGKVLSPTTALSSRLSTLAAECAIANQPSQLVVHRADETIEDEWTYGDDPYPPPG